MRRRRLEGYCVLHVSFWAFIVFRLWGSSRPLSTLSHYMDTSNFPEQLAGFRCIFFTLLQLWDIINWVVWDTGNLFSQNSGGQKFEGKVLAGMDTLPQGSGWNLSLTTFKHWQSVLEILDFYRVTLFCFHLRMVFSSYSNASNVELDST